MVRLGLPLDDFGYISLLICTCMAFMRAVLSFWERRVLREVEEFERARETWEMSNFPMGEIQVRFSRPPSFSLLSSHFESILFSRK